MKENSSVSSAKVKRNAKSRDHIKNVFPQFCEIVILSYKGNRYTFKLQEFYFMLHLALIIMHICRKYHQY